MIKLIARINQHGERIKHIDKSNKIAACPLCGEIEDSNHVTFCENNRSKREEWVKSLVIKLKSIE